MTQDLHEPITVKTLYNSKKRKVFPTEILWQNEVLKIKKLGLHYTYKTGLTLFHVFAVDTEALSFKLQLDTSNLFWTVEQISDGLPD